MFPIPWNFPFRKKNGNVVNIEDAISGGGGGGSDLPSYDSGDAGKILGVDDNGDLEWSDKVEDLTTSVETIETNLGSITESVEELEEDLTNEVVTRGSLGAKNLLPNNAVSQTISGVTYTVNSDGSVTVNGTATGNAFLEINKNINFFTTNIDAFTEEVTQNDYTLSKGYAGSDVRIGYTTSNTTVWLFVGEGTTVNNVKVYPMIRLATDSDPTYQPYSMTNQELTPIAQAVSNRNLLDNPWFTVNQRGATTITQGELHIADRWKFQNISTEASISIDSSGLLANLKNNDGIKQFFEGLIPDGVYTLSIKINDVVYSKTITIRNGSTTSAKYDESLPYSYALITSNNHSVLYPLVVYGTTLVENIRISSIKLELGEVSTLHMDTAPNYAEELLKCQRYFQVIPQNTTYRITCATNDGPPFAVDTVLMLPVPMRDRPSIVNNGVELDIQGLDAIGFAGSSWSIPSLATGAPYSNVLLRVTHNQALQVTDGSIMIYNKNLELSADL